jgi:hypothetical protein
MFVFIAPGQKLLARPYYFLPNQGWGKDEKWNGKTSP